MNQDLISRQAILKHIEKKRQDALMIDDLRESNIIMMGMKLLEEAVRIQPSAQPEKMQLSKEDATKGTTFDCISRQAAIEAMNRHLDTIRVVNNNTMEMIRRSEAMDCREIINGLPSVQQEIIRCKDCKWCDDADGLMCKNPASWVVATDYDFGCVCAERRQDGTRD